jgi:hypothetical protein
LPEDVALRRDLRRRVDLAVFFVGGRAALARTLPKLVSVLEAGGGAWVAWPKKSSGIVTDLTEDGIRDIVLPAGLVDIKVCAIDATWSGLRIARRRTHVKVKVNS